MTLRLKLYNLKDTMGPVQSYRTNQFDIGTSSRERDRSIQLIQFTPLADTHFSQSDHDRSNLEAPFGPDEVYEPSK